MSRSGDPAAAATVLETGRLRLRELDAGDGPFLVELLNDPDFLHHIGDRGVRTVADAERYVADGPAASYRRYGFGLWRVELRGDGTSIGICGLLKRDVLKDVDLGFAFLPAFRRQGYALEAARGTLEHARGKLGLRRIVAIVSPGNEPSTRLLGKLGFTGEGTVRLGKEDEVLLFASEPG